MFAYFVAVKHKDLQIRKGGKRAQITVVVWYVCACICVCMVHVCEANKCAPHVPDQVVAQVEFLAGLPKLFRNLWTHIAQISPR